MIRVKTNSLLLKFGATFLVMGIIMYPIAIGPMIDPSYYQEVQKVNRKGIIQEEIQPGGMKVWSDPFSRK